MTFGSEGRLVETTQFCSKVISAKVQHLFGTFCGASKTAVKPGH
jgi:hypothetical protein